MQTSLQSIWTIFTTLQRNLIPNSDHSPPTPWILANINLLFCLYGFIYCGHFTFHFLLASLRIMCMCNFTSFWGQMIFYCMDIPHLFIHSLVDGCLSGFHFWALIYAMVLWTLVLEQLVLWTFMYKFLCVHVFISLGYITLRRIARSFGNTLFNIPRNYQTIFKATVPHYIPISNVYGFQFLYILIDICYENLTFWLQFVK